MIYAVIDTNVLISALLTHNSESATVKVVEAIFCGVIVPMFDDEILNEYHDVLNRPKFKFSKNLTNQLLCAIIEKGVFSKRIKSEENFSDLKDVVFYEVAMSKDDAYLVTGNTKHFPRVSTVVTPAEMMTIIETL